MDGINTQKITKPVTSPSKLKIVNRLSCFASGDLALWRARALSDERPQDGGERLQLQPRPRGGSGRGRAGQLHL